MNGKIEMSVDVFIIPNGITTVKDALTKLAKDSELKLIKRVQSMNQLPGCQAWNDDLANEPMVQLWWVSTSPEMPSENLVYHGFDDMDGDHHCFSSEYFPARLFSCSKEGDVITLSVPLTGEDTVAVVHATLAQTKYRYASQGNFDDLLFRQMRSWQHREFIDENVFVDRKEVK